VPVYRQDGVVAGPRGVPATADDGPPQVTARASRRTKRSTMRVGRCSGHPKVHGVRRGRPARGYAGGPALLAAARLLSCCIPSSST
jgi:hypothetical protein